MRFDCLRHRLLRSAYCSRGQASGGVRFAVGTDVARAVRSLPIIEPRPETFGIPPGVILLGLGNTVEAVSNEALL